MMKRFSQFLLFSVIIMLYAQPLRAQLEKVIIEKYYVTDANDATDITCGGISAGVSTYRIYVDLLPGTVLKGIYGDAAHPFTISSTQPFFNHLTDGQSFAKDFIKNRYSENVVALDTWLTLGQTAKKQGNNTYYGVLKDQDDDGSFIGGVNNDGGSEAIAEGLLINNDASCGLALTSSDGMDTLSNTPANWFNSGVLDFISGNDSTIFGSLVSGTSFNSVGFSLTNDGVIGVVPDSNQVIIAQLTTSGELSFVINLQLQYVINGVLTDVNYVGTNELLSENEVFNPYLNYPYSCGCNNPNYLEYDPSFICYTEGSCVNQIIAGCMDSLACNYDPAANYNMAELCCYPGWCGGRDIEEVCPTLKGNSFDFSLYPNPTNNNVTLNVVNGVSSNLSYTIFNSYGVTMKTYSLPQAPLNYSEEISLEEFVPGIYDVKVTTDQGEQHKLFVKL
jgi:hypothetical protein